MGKINNITNCNKTLCYNLTLDYSVSQTNIISQIEKSDKCYQEITFLCFASKISQFATWVDRNGEYRKYFTGIDKNLCECSKNESCFQIGDFADFTISCNCDHGDPVRRKDTIKIKNKVRHFSTFF